ncbi:MAG: polysaccharide export protein [Gammaproteobacteria bacterium]|nr:polysaccharide export protein [Gammaproteobacteria bacterium]
MKYHQILAAVLLPLWFGLTSCMSLKPIVPEESGAGGPMVLVGSYKMAVGDQLQITVWKNPELSVAEPIRPDGKISVPLVGDVMAVGKTPEELSKIIEKEMSAYIKYPNVTIVLTNLQGHAFLSRIRVTGSVNNSLSINYHQGMTVLDAVLEAGGPDPYADSNNTKLHRRVDNRTKAYDVRLDDIMKDGDMTTNVILMPGDIITVPERWF